MLKVNLQNESLQLCGLPWFSENGNQLWRLPLEIDDHVSHALWEMAQRPSGGRIRFRSNTTSLGMLIDFHSVGPDSGAANKIARMGLDLYAEGQYWNSIYPEADGINESVFFEGAEAQFRDYTIYLPIAKAIEIKKIMMDEDAVIAPPSPFAVPKPVVFYGTSITQGGCASRPGLAYPAQLSRKLNVDFVNLGFSGLGKGDLPVARAMAQLDVACYVLDYAQNNPTIDELDRVYLPFLTEIRKNKPDTPIVLTTPITYRGEVWNVRFREEQERKRQIIRNAYKHCTENGDLHIYLIEGEELISVSDGEGQMDGAHPNDIGFQKMAESLTDIVRTALKLL